MLFWQAHPRDGGSLLVWAKQVQRTSKVHRTSWVIGCGLMADAGLWKQFAVGFAG